MMLKIVINQNTNAQKMILSTFSAVEEVLNKGK